MTSSWCRTISRTKHAPGFALPIVMLLSMIGVIVIASMLTRYGSQNRFVQKHRNRYVEHHTQRGVQEMVGTWLDLVRGGPLTEILRDDGLAFVMEIEGGQRMEVFVHDGQGTLLVNFAAMNDRERRVCEKALAELQTDTPFDQVDLLTRTKGPAGVSVMMAPLNVIRAVLVGAGVEGNVADRVADDFEDERLAGEISHQTVLRLLGATGVSPESRGFAAAILTARPSLYEFETHLYDRPGQPMTARYAGLVEVDTSTTGRGTAQSTFKPTGPFLTWQVLDVN